MFLVAIFASIILGISTPSPSTAPPKATVCHYIRPSRYRVIFNANFWTVMKHLTEGGRDIVIFGAYTGCRRYTGNRR